MKRFFYVTLLTLFTVSVFFASRTIAGGLEEETTIQVPEETHAEADPANADVVNRPETTETAEAAENEPAVMRTHAATEKTDEPEPEKPRLAVTLSGAVTDTEAEAEINLDVPLPYYIRINRIANTVTVYGADRDGAHTIPYKAFVCSAGEYTPLGTFQTSTKARWLSLVGGVWGQYTTRISGPYWFHSVPYFTQSESDLEYLEYNKLGDLASLGCIRMSVEDVKWIYDNCPAGTTVELYDDEADPGPLGKPVPPLIATDSEKRGWDPTDPHPDNPWRRLYAPSYQQPGGVGKEAQ